MLVIDFGTLVYQEDVCKCTQHSLSDSTIHAIQTSRFRESRFGEHRRWFYKGWLVPSSRGWATRVVHLTRRSLQPVQYFELP